MPFGRGPCTGSFKAVLGHQGAINSQSQSVERAKSAPIQRPFPAKTVLNFALNAGL